MYKAYGVSEALSIPAWYYNHDKIPPESQEDVHVWNKLTFRPPVITDIEAKPESLISADPIEDQIFHFLVPLVMFCWTFINVVAWDGC